MSGPKVVRIVTREERLAQSTAIAKRLQQMLDRWREAAQQAGELAVEELAQTQQRHAQIGALLESDSFDRFNQEAGREIAFLATDLEQRRERGAQRRAAERQAQMRGIENARVLLQSLASRSIRADKELLEALERAVQGSAPPQAVEKALAAGFRLLAPGEHAPSLSAAQRQLAQRLAQDGADLSLAQWKAAQEPAAEDPRLVEIARQLEMLRLLDAEPAAVTVFAQRLEQCRLTSSGTMLGMQLDSLMLELAAAVREARALEERADEAKVLLSDLSTLENEQASQVRAQLQAALAGRNGQAVQQAVDAGRSVMATNAKAETARARRSAVLENLAKLGYAVHEGMETAWVEAGRIVVHKPSLEGYGVELSGAPDAQRMQVRTVALAEDRDTSRDTDAEQLWCGDFDKLREQLAQQGSNVSVERALGVGSVPLKLALNHAVDASRTLSKGNARSMP